MAEPNSDEFRQKVHELSWKYTSSLKNFDMANLSQLIVRRAAIVDILDLACGKRLAMQASADCVRRKDEQIIHSIFFPNQINNVLCFPGIFRGALDVRARDITEEMKMAAAQGIASIVGDDELREDYVVPSVFNRDVADAVAAAVADQAKAQGTAEVRGDEVGYSRGETGEFRAIRP